MANQFPKKVEKQIKKAGLPRTGSHPFEPQLKTNTRGQLEIGKAEVKHGPKKGKKGYVDDQGRIWIKCRAHSGLPDHWDVQIDEGKTYFNVDTSGNELSELQE